MQCLYRPISGKPRPLWFDFCLVIVSVFSHGKATLKSTIKRWVRHSVWKSQKSLIQHCERSELRLHFEWTEVNQKCQKWSNLASFWKLEACCQTVLPDWSFLIGQKLVENAKIQVRTFELFSNNVRLDSNLGLSCFSHIKFS